MKWKGDFSQSSFVCLCLSLGYCWYSSTLVIGWKRDVFITNEMLTYVLNQDDCLPKQCTAGQGECITTQTHVYKPWKKCESEDWGQDGNDDWDHEEMEVEGGVIDGVWV